MALVQLFLFSPIILTVTIVLFFANKGKPFFLQKRPGLNEKIFSVFKFKTMTDQKDENGNLLPDGQRLTRIGILLRKTSLDELPQLFNVLLGQMSFVGPRPLRVRYIPYYTEKERLRHSVRPGITGLAQISGRNYLRWDDRLGKDVEYVQKISFKLDLYIVLKTIYKVILQKDVQADSNSIVAQQDLDVERQGRTFR